MAKLSLHAVFLVVKMCFHDFGYFRLSKQGGDSVHLIFVTVSYIHPIHVKKVKRHYREIYVVHKDDVTAEV